MKNPDYIIVGAGSAGCVLACRLIEQGHSVVLFEAGRPDHRLDFRIHMPAALSHVLGSTTYNWNYLTAPEPHMNNRRIFCPRGKTLGGSSSINGMIYVHGHARDFDRWAELSGYGEWDFAGCLPWFKKAEDAPFGDPALRGIGGPLHISRGALANPLFDAFLEAGQQAGHALSDDLNGAVQEGVGVFDRTIYRGRRWSTARAYLDRVRGSSRLSVVTGSHIARVVMEGNRARGVEVIRRGRREHLTTDGEVLLCAGALNSPQILMLSGIGDQERLSKFGIAEVAHLPGVGRHLQDHLEVYVQYECREPVSIYPLLSWYNQAWIGVMWYTLHKGPAATNHFEAGGFIRSSEDIPWPDLQMHFLPVAMNYDGTETAGRHGFQVHVGPMKPTSRGEVTLTSADPRAAPHVQFNYAASEQDRSVMREGIRKVRDIVGQRAFDELRGDEITPSASVTGDAELDSFVASRGESAYHPCGTCRMGRDAMSVVDKAGRVHGVEGLRVIDASIMPEITNGNINAPTIMLAEKIAATISGD